MILVGMRNSSRFLAKLGAFRLLRRFEPVAAHLLLLEAFLPGQKHDVFRPTIERRIMTGVLHDKAEAAWSRIIPFLRPIEALIRDPEISEIMVNGEQGVFFEKYG